MISIASAFAAAASEKVRFDDIVNRLEATGRASDVPLIRKAYDFSCAAHEGQKRQSGDPYMVHPLGVSLILTLMNLDPQTIVTGLLHDTVEDTLVTLDEVRDNFGDDVAQLVDGVTKLSKIHFSSREARQAENFRKMFMAMAEDIRVILVKLADRLHNMQTLSHLPEEKRQRIATETIEVYAPIAGRLGMQEIKIELEDYAFYYLKPEIFKRIDQHVARVKKQSSRFIEEVQDLVRKDLEKHHVDADVRGRFKHHYSIYRKMETQNLEFHQIYDIIAFRVMVDDMSQCYEALGSIHSLWRPVPGRFKDYIGMPKLNNYQSLHTTVIGPHGHRLEFQIRTREMHEMAEWGVASHWRYKEKTRMKEKDETKFQWVRQFMEWQRDVKDPAEYLDIVKLDLFATDVYVFTPKGDIREFPRGSTPVDFAYSIHTDVGHRCVGARVNGRIVPLRYILRSGDTVEIITRSGQRPSKDWLKFVQTSKARSNIRQYIRKQQRDKASDIGRELLQKEFAKFGADLNRQMKEKTFRKFLDENSIGSGDELMAQVGYGKMTPNQVVAAVLPGDRLKKEKEPRKETTLSRIFRRATERTRGIVRVQGLDDILVSMAKCCSPIPGDSVIGLVTRGRGVKVHRLDCSRALSIDPARRVDVAWEDESEQRALAKIRMVCLDRPGQLAEISKEISARGVNISNAVCRSIGDEKALNTFEVTVKGTRELNRLIQGLGKLKGVISVERIVS